MTRPFLSPTQRPKQAAEAITVPSAILLGAGAASLGILAGVPLAGAALVGALAWAGRVALAWPRGPRQPRIDAARLRDPWRSLVRDSQGALRRFQDALRTTQSGPIRERLGDIGRRVEIGVRECWAIASRGDALDQAVSKLDVDGVRRQLAHVHGEIGQCPPASRPDLEQVAASLQQQIDTAERLGGVARSTYDRLRRIDAQLDEAAARAVEVSLDAADAGALQPLGSDVETLVGELESLRLGLEETERQEQPILPPPTTATSS